MKAPTSGKALLVNPKALIAAARRWRKAKSFVKLDEADAYLVGQVDAYERRLRKGGRKPRG